MSKTIDDLISAEEALLPDCAVLDVITDEVSLKKHISQQGRFIKFGIISEYGCLPATPTEDCQSDDIHQNQEEPLPYNPRYTVTIDNRKVLDNINQNMYDMWFYNKSIAKTTQYLGHTTIKYFGIFPEWVLGFIIPGYYVIILIFGYLSVGKDKLLSK